MQSQICCVLSGNLWWTYKDTKELGKLCLSETWEGPLDETDLVCPLVKQVGDGGQGIILDCRWQCTEDLVICQSSDLFLADILSRHAG